MTTLRTIFEDHYVLLLVVRPGDETRECGGFIAESCARGRPPFVCVVTDGSSEAIPAMENRSPAQIAQTKADRTDLAMAQLDLPEERLAFFGLYDGSAPQDGPRFSRLVDAVADIARRYDCSTVCAPLRPGAAGDHLAVQTLARALAARAGLRLVWRVTAPPGDPGAARRLDIGACAARKRTALETVTGGSPDAEAEPFEVFLPADPTSGPV